MTHDELLIEMRRLTDLLRAANVAAEATHGLINKLTAAMLRVQTITRKLESGAAPTPAEIEKGRLGE